MNYYIAEIKRIARQRNITLKDLALSAGMTEVGFHQSIKNNSLQFKTVLKICNILEIKLSDLQEKNPNNIFENINNEEKFRKELLKTMHFICDKINKIDQQIDIQTNKCNSCKPQIDNT